MSQNILSILTSDSWVLCLRHTTYSVLSLPSVWRFVWTCHNHLWQLWRKSHEAELWKEDTQQEFVELRRHLSLIKINHALVSDKDQRFLPFGSLESQCGAFYSIQQPVAGATNLLVGMFSFQPRGEFTIFSDPLSTRLSTNSHLEPTQRPRTGVKLIWQLLHHHVYQHNITSWQNHMYQRMIEYLYPRSPDTVRVAGGVVVLLHSPPRDLAVGGRPPAPGKWVTKRLGTCICHKWVTKR